MEQYGDISASFMEYVGKNDQILNSGVRKNLMPKLLDLNYVERIKLSRTRCLYRLTEQGKEYLRMIERVYQC